MPHAQRADIRVIGIGNPFRRDDGAGIEVARRLKARLSPGITVIEQSGEAAALMDAWQGAETVILIDALVSGAAPGALRCIDLRTEKLPAGLCRASSHALGVAEAVALARQFKQLPARPVLIGIEGQDFSEGTEFSGAVAGAIENAVRLAIDTAGLQDLEARQHKTQPQSLRIVVEGTVQGVGFRPFVYRLARSLDLKGWVENSPKGVLIAAEGSPGRLDILLKRIRRDAPVHSVITGITSTALKTQGGPDFEIRQSKVSGNKQTGVLPDIAPCNACLQELFDPRNRRYRYPFINCTHCGPRFSITEALPYDRARTSMSPFTLCAACRAEYHDPNDRRFHAQANACADCGPQPAYLGPDGKPQSTNETALRDTAAALRAGHIVAVKGIGGFHLMADARNEGAVLRLRERKKRPAKPFALMYPALKAVYRDCIVSRAETALLGAPAAPLVLLRRQTSARIAPAVAPDNPDLGVMLPASPLHHLLMRALGFPLVATSANRSGEPICANEADARKRLKGIADGFLIHNRAIVRPLDDSVLRVTAGQTAVLRRGRGLPLLSLPLNVPCPPLLAVGGHLKNTIALTHGRHILLSPHIGDLESAAAIQRRDHTIEALQGLHGTQARHIACDAHPDYASSQCAARQGLPLTPVQHHHAHVAACMAEHGLKGEVFGIAWDGAGFGPDGTVWGGEFLRASARSFERLAFLRPFRLPGGESAQREPRRAALGLLYELYGDKLFETARFAPLAACSSAEKKILQSMLKRGINAPYTSGMGRLFDAIASLSGLRQGPCFEGEAAMALEFAARKTAAENPDESYAFDLRPGMPCCVDWAPMLHGILRNMEDAVPVSRIAKKFHRSLLDIMVALARRFAENRIVLTGGCFQNRILLEQGVARLREAGFEVYWPQQAPPNDGGIALGQAFVAAQQLGAK